MPIRVISGTAKGRKLKLVPGDSTRPIMDRVKESLFNILGRQIIGTTFLDLFSGTGSVGIEALSRGAERAMFVEREAIAVKTIQENLKSTQLEKNAIIRRTDVFTLLKAPAPSQPFDYIFIAPPQYKGLWLDTLKALDDNPDWVPEGTTVIVQIDPKEGQALSLAHLEVSDKRQYGRTELIFLERKEEVEESTDE